MDQVKVVTCMFVAFMFPDQDPQTGELAIDHITRTLGSKVYFGHKFNTKDPSPLRNAINEAREKTFMPYLNVYNENALNGTVAYKLAKPRSIPSLENGMKNRLVTPVEITLAVQQQDIIEDSEGYATFFNTAEVVNTKILSTRICNPFFRYATWHEVEYGKKAEYMAAQKERWERRIAIAEERAAANE